mgnify:CR=1 FL=1
MRTHLAGLLALAWNTVLVRPARVLVVLIHEIFHALASLVSGGGVLSTQNLWSYGSATRTFAINDGPADTDLYVDVEITDGETGLRSVLTKTGNGRMTANKGIGVSNTINVAAGYLRVQADPAHGEDSPLYRSMGFVPLSERKSGLTRNGSSPSPTTEGANAA